MRANVSKSISPAPSSKSPIQTRRAKDVSQRSKFSSLLFSANKLFVDFSHAIQKLPSICSDVFTGFRDLIHKVVVEKLVHWCGFSEVRFEARGD